MGNASLKQDSKQNETLVSLLLPIGRIMLNSGYSVGDLIRASKHAYVRAAMDRISADGFRVNASHVSVATGLTRKEVTAILKELSGQKRRRPNDTKEQRAVRVIRGWKIDSRFRLKNGEPATLELSDSPRSFAALVRQYGGDVTPKAVLRELQRMNLVVLHKSGKLKLRSRSRSLRSTELVDTLARLFPDFAETVSPTDSNEQPPFFACRTAVVDSTQQAGRFQRTFSNRASTLVESVEQWIATSAVQKGGASTNRHRVGIGIYLIHGIPAAQEASHSQRSPTRRQRAPQ